VSNFDLQLHAALSGTFEEEIGSAQAWLEQAVTRALDDASENFLTKLREDVRQSGLKGAERLRTTWRKRRYPERDFSLDPAAFVYSKMPQVVAAFEKGATVTSPDGKWLTIPNPTVWPRRFRRLRGDASMLATAEARFGKLRFVYRAGHQVAYLVAELRASQKSPGKFRKASARAMKTGTDLSTVIVFFLVRQARLPRLLKGATIRERAKRDFPADVGRRLPQILNSTPRPRVIAGSYRT
jgi:hypothetical protein